MQVRRHVFQQGPVIGALLRTAVRAATRTVPDSSPELPGPKIQATVAPRPRLLIDDFIRWGGGQPSAYRGIVPPQLFPQWGFPLMAKTLTTIPYDLVKVMNAGCRLDIRSPLPDREPLELSAQLTSIDDDGRRAILEQQLVTGTQSAPDALLATLYAYVPTGGPKEGGRKGKKRHPRVPEQVREIGEHRLAADAGLQFAALTGDFNPIHWVRPYARAAGFRSTILHGFGTLQLALEALNRTRFSGDPKRLRTVEVRFVRPLVLPRTVRTYIDDNHGLFVGERPGGPAYLTGAFTHV